MALHTSTAYRVTVMTCDHCVRAVRDAVGALPNVVDVEIELASGALTVESEGALEEEAVREAVEEAGYQMVAR